MNALQVIAHMIFLPVKFPPCTIDVFESVYKLISFEVIPGEITGPIQSAIIELPESRPFSPAFKQMGADTGYILSNMFLPLVCICFYLTTSVIHYIIYHSLKKYRDI